MTDPLIKYLEAEKKKKKLKCIQAQKEMAV